MGGVDQRWRKEWESKNPVLVDGQIGLELNSNRMKVGDGKTPWKDLRYVGHTGSQAVATVLDGGSP